jgi:hypothetical protein
MPQICRAAMQMMVAVAVKHPQNAYLPFYLDTAFGL